MPTSPSLRRSPAKENAHRRGHSFGSTLRVKSKDDELMLFNDMQKNERENFLLEPSDNFGESFSKLNYFPDFKLGINIAGRAEGRDMLKTDGGKNDYDWLLTPPATPLFRSLDDEEDQRICPVARGRTQSKPLSISRPSTMQNTHRSSRSSASPSRLSPSTRSSSSAALARTRSLNSSSRCSPSLVLQPSRRPSSPPPVKTLTPPRRSPSPASRRIITGSSGPALNGTRVVSPLKDTRRSSSPKLQAWLSNDPGFSFDAPPNLRTSLPDRPVSRSRGGSPSSFSGLDVGSRGRRQSISPIPSRRASSSHSNEQDRSGSFSKASATSSGDDDLECVLSVPVGYASNQTVKKNLPVLKTRTMALPKKPSKSFSPIPAPKRSFDSAVWLMDHRKAPQDMFRPLLSSVPTTTLGSGKGSNVHQPMFSHNSSVTTSSNASSEHGGTFGPCMDTNQGRHDLAGEWEATASSGIHDDIFMFDKLDEGSSCHQHSLSPTRSGSEDLSSTEKYVKSSRREFDLEGSRTAEETSCDVASSSKAGHGKMVSCTRCRKLFHAMEVDGGDYCEECALRDVVFATDPNIQTIEEPHQHDHIIVHCKPHIPSVCLTAPGCVKDSIDVSLDHQPVINESPADYSQTLPTQSMVDTTEEMLLGQHLENLAENIRLHDIDDSLLENSNGISSHQCSASDCQSTCMMEGDLFRDKNGHHDHEMPECLSESCCQGNEFVSDIRTSDSNQLRSIGSPNLKVENTKGTGISILLLHKLGINKYPVVGGSPLAAINILCSEPYYTRDNVNIMEHSIERDSTSAISSIDLGSLRQSDVCSEHHKVIKRGDFSNSQINSTISHQSIASVSDMSNSGSLVSLCPQSDVDRDACYPINNSRNNSPRTMVSTGQHQSCKDVLSSAIDCWSVAQAIVNDDGEAVGDAVIQNQTASRMDHDYDLNINMCSSYSDMPSDILQASDADGSCIKESEEDISAITNYSIHNPKHPCGDSSFDNLQMQSEAVPVSDELKRLDDRTVSAISEEDVLVSGTGSEITNLPDDEGSSKQIRRCFTLEEATDAILLCNSIVHGIAYNAATIALENEPELASALRPRVSVVEKSIQKEHGSLKLPHRRTPKPKVKRKRLEGETIAEATELEIITKDLAPVHSAAEIAVMSDSMKPPRVESKCNCTIM